MAVRHPIKCRNGHLWADNLQVDDIGRSRCKACAREQQSRRRKRLAEARWKSEAEPEPFSPPPAPALEPFSPLPVPAPTRRDPAEVYVGRIPDPRQRAYAQSYLEWLRAGGPCPDSERIGYGAAWTIGRVLRMLDGSGKGISPERTPG